MNEKQQIYEQGTLHACICVRSVEVWFVRPRSRRKAARAAMLCMAAGVVRPPGAPPCPRRMEKPALSCIASVQTSGMNLSMPLRHTASACTSTFHVDEKHEPSSSQTGSLVLYQSNAEISRQPSMRPVKKVSIFVQDIPAHQQRQASWGRTRLHTVHSQHNRQPCSAIPASA